VTCGDAVSLRRGHVRTCPRRVGNMQIIFLVAAPSEAGEHTQPRSQPPMGHVLRTEARNRPCRKKNGVPNGLGISLCSAQWAFSESAYELVESNSNPHTSGSMEAGIATEGFIEPPASVRQQHSAHWPQAATVTSMTPGPALGRGVQVSMIHITQGNNIQVYIQELWWGASRIKFYSWSCRSLPISSNALSNSICRSFARFLYIAMLEACSSHEHGESSSMAV
jgi:hypothetical protein